MMRSKRYHHSQIFLLCVILTWPPLRIFSTILDHTLSSNDFLSPSNNRTLVSPGKIFELGFFNLSSRWYLGMWYKNQLITRDYVWVANRDKPLSNPLGTLKLSDANLEIRDESTNILLWSTNLARRKTKTPLLAELLDNGNFVIRFKSGNVSDEFLWQSFDFPTDTLLPEMKLGWTKRRSSLNRVLQSWASPHDPSSGDFRYFIDTTTRGLPQRIITSTKGGNLLSREDSWNGIGSSGQPATDMTENLKVDFTMTDEEITYSFRVITINKIYSKLKMAYTGQLQRLARSQSSEKWVFYWKVPSDVCENYAACGSYGQCDTNMSPMCRCIEGFKPRNEDAWTGMDFKDGCERKTPLSNNGDTFHHLKGIKLPDTKTVTLDKGIEFKQCVSKCGGDSNCTAFAYVHMWNGATLACLIWTGELIDIRVFSAHGQDLHVKVANSTDPHVKVANPDDHGDERSKSRMIIGLIIVGLAGTIVLCFVIFYFWNRKQKRARANAVAIERTAVRPTRLSLSGENEDLALPRMELKTVVTATDNFSYALGQGGFGSVYKGKLLDGTLIAVKRLSKMSVQGTIEFENEVRLIAKLQHINLVRLLGFCVDMEERILIYEYLENLSLDFYLFAKTESSKLNWRKRFDITKGIAQGIQYLHQESRFRIIHKDLKASNVLLDKDMIPKISDFGMARIIGNNEAEVNTRTVVGTIGYMSPEYRMHGVFSTKSDVFSFGVLMLEILSGKRNRGFTNLRGDTSLLTCAWRNWEEGNWLETIDPQLIVELLSSSPSALEEVRRCFQIALLCVQENASDRPMMSSVVMMLGSEAAIPWPKVSGYCVHCVGKRSTEIGSSSGTTNESWTANQVTISVIDPR